jgi:hypothetical protein
MIAFQRAVELMEAELGEEIVALDVEGGTCFGFNEVASAVWRALEKPRTFDMLRDQLLKDYDVGHEKCEAELAQLLDDLTAKGLIARVELQRAQGI